jgi:hypothetical protein
VTPTRRRGSHEALLRDLYDAFNRRDVDAVIAALHPDVDWPNAFEGGRVHGRVDVRTYELRDGLVVRMDVSRSPPS